MEELPNSETLAEYALRNYRESLTDDALSYNDVLIQAQKLIEGLGYPSTVVAALHDGLFPSEELFDADTDTCIYQLQRLPSVLLTFLMPQMYGRATDRWMDEALGLATDSISSAHDDCFYDPDRPGSDLLHDPIELEPWCGQEDDCPLRALRNTLLSDIGDSDMLKWHTAFDDESADDDLDYRERLIMACQRAHLLTPMFADGMVAALRDVVQQNNDTE